MADRFPPTATLKYLQMSRIPTGEEYHVTSIKLPANVYAQLRQLALAEDRTVSSLIRRAVRREILLDQADRNGDGDHAA